MKVAYISNYIIEFIDFFKISNILQILQLGKVISNSTIETLSRKCLIQYRGPVVLANFRRGHTLLMSHIVKTQDWCILTCHITSQNLHP